ncbi:small ribosomal subunit protein bS1c isoform X5 [Elaeis guineensis]|uniref:Uncharacterized protein LOC105049595 isoform X5 n=1 Tax=Elaeis guineensis var. tenera TaxID=51953 RepID=A0A6I9RJ35_ELAGV|nr:uncharacterized protein LOC105049595 isoform X5 [Elaeis guineensis]XP_010927604.1 uncharacterized protein LOC105049595 isoform X5 [Elaeis guineensis]
MFAAAGGLSLVSRPYGIDGSSNPSVSTPVTPSWCRLSLRRRLSSARSSCTARLVSSGSSVDQEEASGEGSKTADEDARQARRSADWRAARAYKDSGIIFDGRIEGFNNGGLLIRFYSLLGFLPYPLLSPSHSCKDPPTTIQDIAKDLVGSSIPMKVLEANEEEKKLIFSEKDAVWSKYSSQVKVGDVFDARVGSVEDYGAFVHLRYPDGFYYLTGLVHVSEVSWDLVQDVRDFLNEGDQVRVKVIHIDSITGVRLGRQGLEKRVVSQDLELWLSNIPAKDKQFTLLARAGRQVQEVYLTTTLDQDGIKKAVQRVLGRVP